jgi:site-specific recombinase XerD
LTHVVESGRAVATAVRYSSGIRHAHLKAGFKSPLNAEVARLLAGARRLLQQQPKNRAALTVRQLRGICRLMRGRDLLTIRNRALLVLGFASALRRCNIAALKLSDVRQTRTACFCT